MKASNMNWHVDYLLDAIPNSYILHIERDIRYNAQSLLMARRKYFGTIDTWYSFKPPNYSELKNMPPIEQVLHQVIENNRAIKSVMHSEARNNHRYWHISYEELCSEPTMVCQEVLDIWQIKKSQTAMSYALKNQNRKTDYWPEIDAAARNLGY